MKPLSGINIIYFPWLVNTDFVKYINYICGPSTQQINTLWKQKSIFNIDNTCWFMEAKTNKSDDWHFQEHGYKINWDNNV